MGVSCTVCGSPVPVSSGVCSEVTGRLCDECSGGVSFEYDAVDGGVDNGYVASVGDGDRIRSEVRSLIEDSGEGSDSRGGSDE